MPSNDLTPEEVADRMPYVDLITDSDTREATIDAIATHAPDYFWTAPAASSYTHHNPYCCSERGLWVHVLMTATAYERLVHSYTASNRITKHEADLGRAAILLHDLRKYGDRYADGETSDMDHDLQAARLIRRNTELDDRVADAISSHMGSWYNGPEPETELQQLVHSSDMVASTKNGTFGIWRCPEEIRDLYPSLPSATLQR